MTSPISAATGVLTYLAVGLAAIFVSLSPMGVAPGSLPSPDLLTAASFYWIRRRPDSAPIWAIFAMAALRDLLCDGPVGAYAFALMLCCEFIRRRGTALSHLSFAAEWLVFAVFVAAVHAITLMLALFVLTPLPEMMEILMRTGVSILAYPLLAAFLRWILRISATTGRSSAIHGYGGWR